MPRELKCSMEEFFAPDAKDREVATRMAPDGSTLVQTKSVRASGEVVTIWRRKESTDVEPRYE